MDRRGFLKRFGIGGVGIAGAAIVPIPGSVLDDSAPQVSRSSRHPETRERATDEDQPKADYGLQVQSDRYVPNPDLTRLYSSGTSAPRPGFTNVYVRAWIDEEVYGIRRRDGTIDEAKQATLSRAFAEAVKAVDRIMTPTLQIMRRTELRHTALDAGNEVPHAFIDGGHASEPEIGR